jgi:hypothetical protein
MSGFCMHQEPNNNNKTLPLFSMMKYLGYYLHTRQGSYTNCMRAICVCVCVKHESQESLRNIEYNSK